MNANEKGFTLLELLIAVVVLAFGILGLIGLQVAALNGNLSSIEMTTAMTLAQDEVEQLKRLALTNAALTDGVANTAALTTIPGNTGGFDHTNADNPDPNNIANPIDERGGTTGLRRYYRFWNIADDTPTEDVKTVVVFVGWGALTNGIPRHMVRVQTIIGG